MAEPKDPNELTILQEAAHLLHEMYLSYKEAGFSDAQAFELVQIHLINYLEDTE